MVIDRTSIAIANTYEMKLPIGFRLVYLYLILTHSRGESQGHSQFDCNKFNKTESCCVLLYVNMPILNEAMLKIN